MCGMCIRGISLRRFSIRGAGGMQTLKITGNILMSELSLIRKRNVNDLPWSSVYNLWTNKHTVAEITLCDMNVIAHGSNNLCITCSRCIMLCFFFFSHLAFGLGLTHSHSVVPCKIQRHVSVAPLKFNISGCIIHITALSLSLSVSP